jgi:hypothetical protein
VIYKARKGRKESKWLSETQGLQTHFDRIIVAVGAAIKLLIV